MPTGICPDRTTLEKLLLGKFLAAGGGAAALILLGIIVITITNKDGKKTTIRVSGGTEIDVDAEPGSKVSIREETTGDPAPSMASGGRQPNGTPSEISNLKSQISNPEAGWHGWAADAPPPAIAPFDAEQAQHHQEAWAKYLGVPVEYTNFLCMKFRLIPPGEFMMGSTAEQIEKYLALVTASDWVHTIRSQGPQHRVILTRPFYQAETEVTQSEYKTVMKMNPSQFCDEGGKKDLVAGIDTSSHPVDTVSWNESVEFCEKLSRMHGFAPFYSRDGASVSLLEGTGYHLPTEAEWEYACRAGTNTKCSIGDSDKDLLDVGWSNDNRSSRGRAIRRSNRTCPSAASASRNPTRSRPPKSPGTSSASSSRPPATKPKPKPTVSADAIANSNPMSRSTGAPPAGNPLRTSPSRKSPPATRRRFVNG